MYFQHFVPVSLKHEKKVSEEKNYDQAINSRKVFFFH